MLEWLCWQVMMVGVTIMFVFQQWNLLWERNNNKPMGLVITETLRMSKGIAMVETIRNLLKCKSCCVER